MTESQIYTASQIFDGHVVHRDSAIAIIDGKVDGIISRPKPGSAIDLGEGMLAPGLVDLQVNGGGGVMLNDEPTVAGIRAIEAAHLLLGTTAIMPTLITATRERTTRAIEAARFAVPGGTIGLHLEGPHLDSRRKGAHRAEYIRPMEQSDLDELIAAAKALPSLILTVAPASVTAQQAAQLREAGAILSLGHSDCSFEQAATMPVQMATHLFNAMSQLTGRAPGLVGAALARGDIWAGLIADGVHVSAHSIRLALRAKVGPGGIFLVSDAMATAGSDIRSFELDGREILRGDGRLVLPDGTLAGADIDLFSCVLFMHRKVGLSLEEALRMATLYPATAISRQSEIGSLQAGAAADMIYIDAQKLAGVWKAGRKVT